MKRLIILIDRKGIEAHSLYYHPNDEKSSWLHYDGKIWGFGVANINGKHYYYEILNT